MLRATPLALAALVSCAPPAPSADAGLPDAGPTAGGAPVVDAGQGGGAGDAGLDAGAGESDGGPPEPRGSIQLLASEDFERYASTGELKAGYGDLTEVGAELALDTTTAAGGTKSVRVDYGLDAGCVDANPSLSKRFSITTPTTLAVRYRFRLSPGFRFQQPPTHCGGAGTASQELVVERDANGRGTIVLSAGAEPSNPPVAPALDGLRWQVEVRDVRATQTPATPHARYRQHLRFPRLGPAAVADGRWHSLTVLVSREPQAGSGAGVVQAWIDGEAVLDADGTPNGASAGRVFSGTAQFGRFTVPSRLLSGASASQTRWLDDVLVFEP